MSKNKIETVIEFGPKEATDMNILVNLIRDKVAESLIKKTVCELLGITPAKMSLEERLSFASDIENEKIVVASNLILESGDVAQALDYKESGLSDMLKAAAILEVMGFERLSAQMRKRYGELFVETLMSGVREEAYAKKIISEDRSKAKKGKTNKHHTEALRIAKDTWEKYPNASLAGLSEEIYAHLHKQWNDLPVAGTIKTWLQDSGMNPDVKPKNRNFKLVLQQV
ncbi:TPA: hypothetical protein I8627_000244 [Citrobacter freundii]|nr:MULTISPECIES: hypothetical protein [Enterobacteriaceae]EDF8222692.1 hypothetical protein [Salmonella enterica subsp. enterica serovar Muenchen]EKX5046439.1 hypothetical protein [Citrobacter freundii]ELJ2674544.1 hypothetical protein [Citrobacter freundii]ELK6027121.1 hypothetical protein [Citrobacter freundii]KZQ22660.1 hypothetical protein A3461_14250 [Enterobacter roggenkampii]